MKSPAVVLMLSLAACSRKTSSAGDSSPSSATMPNLIVADDTPNLMFTWIDEKGSAHVETRLADIPKDSRTTVRVVGETEAGTRELFYVADLTRKQDDGSYAVRSMTRRAWEDMIEVRRGPTPTLPPDSPDSPKPVPSQDGFVGSKPSSGTTSTAIIIYGASWCGPCHQAQAYLRSKGVAFIFKDIDEDPTASQEMRQKLNKGGLNGGSIPVIDVRGRLLIGFNPGAVDQALAMTK